jgi:hypothetical protein
MHTKRHDAGLNVVAEWSTLLLRVQEILGSNLSPGDHYFTEVFRGIPQSLQQIPT